MRKYSMCVMFLLCLMLFSVPALANEDSDNATDIRFEQINSIVTEKLKSGSSQEEIKKALEEFGLEHLGNEPIKNIEDGKPKDIAPQASHPSCVDMPIAEIFYDRDEGKYFVYAYFFWLGKCWSLDSPGYNSNLGGEDMFGLSFDRPVHTYSRNFQTWDSSGTRKYNVSSAANQGIYGFYFQEQDRIINSGKDYDWDSGFISCYMLPQNPGRILFWQTLGHTFDKTNIRSVTIGSGGLNVTFSSDGGSWRAVAPYSGSYQFN